MAKFNHPESLRVDVRAAVETAAARLANAAAAFGAAGFAACQAYWAKEADKLRSKAAWYPSPEHDAPAAADASAKDAEIADLRAQLAALRAAAGAGPVTAGAAARLKAEAKAK